ncbi:hypothetical protein ACFL0A_00705 [Patescibacteria group bacterium]
MIIKIDIEGRIVKKVDEGKNIKVAHLPGRIKKDLKHVFAKLSSKIKLIVIGENFIELWYAFGIFPCDDLSRKTKKRLKRVSKSLKQHLRVYPYYN